MKIVIIGAGVAGVTIGSALLKAGGEVTIAEKSPSAAGLALSFSRDGYIFDLGPHIFFGKPVYHQLAEFFDAEKVLVENRDLKRGIYIQGRLYSYPLQLPEILSSMPKLKWFQVFAEITLAHLWTGKPQDTVEKWVKGKVGKTIFDFIELDTYVSKLYGIPASETSSDWSKHRLKPLGKMNLWKRINRAVNPGIKKRRMFTYYPPKGIGEIPNLLADYVRDRHGEILLDTAAESVVVKDGRVAEVRCNQSGKEHTVTGDYVVSTLRIPELIKRIQPAPPTDVLEAASAMRYRNLIILNVIVKREKVFDHCFVYYSTKDTWFKRVTEFKHFSPHMAPEDATSLCVEICVDPGDERWNRDDRWIYNVVVKEMEQMNILKKAEVQEYFTVKVPCVYPVYYLGYEKHLKVLLNYLQSIENLVSVGRGGLHQHDNMATAIESGFHVAELIGAYGHNAPGQVNKTMYEGRLKKYADIP